LATYKLKLDIRNGIAKALLDYIFQLAKSSKAIEITIVKDAKKEKLLEDIKSSLKEVKLMNEGKIPKKTLKQMLGEN